MTEQRSILQQVVRGVKYGVLVVVSLGIFGVIIEYPCMREGSSRSTISRVLLDLRSIGLALESYQADNKSYPTQGIASLTTPVQYMGMYPADPFRKNQPGSHDYAYWAGDGKAGWIVYSPGPDLDYDIVAAEDYVPGSEIPSEGLVGKTYDPTNGTKSGGDIYRFKK